MSEEGNQKLSLVRLAIGVVVLCAVVPALPLLLRSDSPVVLNVLGSVTFVAAGPYALGSVGLAIVVNIAARPNLAAKSSVLMCIASFLTYVLAARLAPHLVEAGNREFAMAGFVGGTLFAMAVHRLLFLRPDPAMSFLVGALTVPAGLVLTFEDRHVDLGYAFHNTFVLFHLAWYLLFALGLGAAAALRGRTVGSRP